MSTLAWPPCNAKITMGSQRRLFQRVIDSGSKGDQIAQMNETNKNNNGSVGENNYKLNIQRKRGFKLKDEDDEKILQIFNDNNEVLNEVKINSELFQQLTKALGFKSKRTVAEKKRDLKKVNYRIAKLISNKSNNIDIDNSSSSDSGNNTNKMNNNSNNINHNSSDKHNINNINMSSSKCYNAECNNVFDTAKENNENVFKSSNNNSINSSHIVSPDVYNSELPMPFEELIRDVQLKNTNSEDICIQFGTATMDENINQLVRIVNKLNNNELCTYNENRTENLSVEIPSKEKCTDLDENSKIVQTDINFTSITTVENTTNQNKVSTVNHNINNSGDPTKNCSDIINNSSSSLKRGQFKRKINNDNLVQSPIKRTKHKETYFTNINQNIDTSTSNVSFDNFDYNYITTCSNVYEYAHSSEQFEAISPILDTQEEYRIEEEFNRQAMSPILNRQQENVIEEEFNRECEDNSNYRKNKAQISINENRDVLTNEDSEEKKIDDEHDGDKTDCEALEKESDFAFHLKDFIDTGLTMTWTREQYQKVLNPKNNRLIAYNKAYGKNVKITEKENALTYHDLVRRTIGECPVYVHNKEDYCPLKKKSRTIKIYAYCMFKECKKFIFISTFLINSSEDITFKILQNKVDMIHDKAKACQMRGRERNDAKKKLRVMTSKDYRKEQIKSLQANKEEFLRTKNLEMCTSVNTIVKMQAETRNDQRMHKDPWESLVLMSEEPDTMIAWLSRKPVTVGVMNKDMVKLILKALKTQGPLDWRFDATGNAWDNPVRSVLKRFLMYSLVTQILSNEKQLTTFTLCEFFSSAHGTANIHINLLNIIEFLQRYTTVPLYKVFRSVVIDFSMAEMNACVKAFNNKTIVEYVIACNRLLELKEKNMLEPVRMVCIRLCSSHISKIMCTDVDIFKPDKSDPDSHVIKCVLLSMFDCTKISNVYSILKLLWKYLLSASIQQKLNVYKELKQYVNRTQEEIIKLEEESDSDSDEPNEDDDPYIDKNTIYESSPNYQKAYSDFLSIVLEEYKDINTLKIENGSTYEFIMKVLKKYIPYIALITPILTYKHYDDDPIKNAAANRGNNGVIEAHHKNTKADIRSKVIRLGNPKIRVDDHIIEILKEDVNTKIAEIELMIPKSRATRNATPGSRKRKNKSLQCISPALNNEGSILRSIKPVNNNVMLSKMNIPDIDKTEESFKKPSMKNELDKGSKKKRKQIRRELFSEEKLRDLYVKKSVNGKYSSSSIVTKLSPKDTKKRVYDIYSSIPGVSKLPNTKLDDEIGVESTPLHPLPLTGTKNILVKFSNISAIPVDDESTKSVLPTIQEESSNNIDKSSTQTYDQKKVQINSKNIETNVTLSECVGLSSDFIPFRGSDTLLDNGLLSDISYYCIPRSSKCDKITVVTFGKESLNIEEWKSLWSKDYKHWVSNFVIDYSLQVLSSKYKFPASFILCSLGGCFFGFREIAKSRLEKYAKQILSSDITFCPIFHADHFTLAVIDNIQNKFYHLDSLRSNSILQGEVMLQKFRKTLFKFKGDDDVIQKLHELRNDNYLLEN